MGSAGLALGVDGGGTKTDAVVCDTSGTVRGLGSASRGNWEYDGIEGATASLAEAVAMALAQAGAIASQIDSSVFALAGLDWPVDEDRLAPVVAELGLGGTTLLVNDAFAALRAGCRHEHGVVSIAGTGTVTAGRNRLGRTFRTMAIGYGERGGGSDLVREALDAIARTRHGQAPPTLLEERFLTALGLPTNDALFEAITRRGLEISSELAPLVLGAAADDDPAAVVIAHEMGDGLAHAVVGVARTLEMQDDIFEVICAGGVHAAGSVPLEAAFRETLSSSCPAAVPVTLAAPPAIGAAILALEQLVAVDVALHDRLLGGVASSILA
jgi:N-acetylglucosamine kinase-like BadF-type ATPase